MLPPEAISMVPPLAISSLAPSIGQHFTMVDALAHGICIFFVAAVFFSLASFLSTLFADIWRPPLIAVRAQRYSASMSPSAWIRRRARLSGLCSGGR